MANFIHRFLVRLLVCIVMLRLSRLSRRLLSNDIQSKLRKKVKFEEKLSPCDLEAQQAEIVFLTEKFETVFRDHMLACFDVYFLGYTEKTFFVCNKWQKCLKAISGNQLRITSLNN